MIMSLNNVQVVRMLSLYRLVHFGIDFSCLILHILVGVCAWRGRSRRTYGGHKTWPLLGEAKMKAGCSDIKIIFLELIISVISIL